jgi:hypothetical protein
LLLKQIWIGGDDDDKSIKAAKRIARGAIIHLHVNALYQ